MDDVRADDDPSRGEHRIASLRAKPLAVRVGEDAVEPVAALDRVVVKELDAVETREPEQRVLFPPHDRPPCSLGDQRETTLQHLCKKVAVPARRLKEPRVDAFALLSDEIEHRPDQLGWREHLPVVNHALLGSHVAGHGGHGVSIAVESRVAASDRSIDSLSCCSTSLSACVRSRCTCRRTLFGGCF